VQHNTDLHEYFFVFLALNKLVRERRRNPDAAVVNNIFHFRNLGMMAYIGGNRGKLDSWRFDHQCVWVVSPYEVSHDGVGYYVNP
jgi:hypothetical protein